MPLPSPSAPQRSARRRIGWGATCAGLVAVTVLLLPAATLGSVSTVRSDATARFSVATAAASSNLSGTWSHLSPKSGQPVARSGASLAFDPVEGLGVLFGGLGPNGLVLNDTWVNDGDFPGGWGTSPYTLTFAPPPLIDAALTFDTTFNEFVLFGGRLSNGSAYGGTWAFGGFEWTDLTGNLRTSPPPDPAPMLAFDAVMGEAVLVSSSDPGATWTFGSGGWTELPSTEWLTPMTNATAIADPATGGVLLFGGESAGADPHPLNETWSFLSSGWQSVATTSAPPAEARPAMAYDLRIPGVLLFSSTSTVSTWTYTTSGWSAWPGGPLPPARADAQLYYDSNAAYDSLFGGIGANDTVLSDNWGWSVPPVVLTPTLGAASIGLTTWAEIGAIIAVPIAVALLLRRRPPRAKPTDAPAATASAAPT
jgi:hypothetical protein